MVVDDMSKHDAPNLRWQGDEETGDVRKDDSRHLTRTVSNSSGLSIRSINLRNTVDPSVALPIQYRSV
jgi:sodium/potassium-transporting ATPase subunit alpha